MSDFLLHWLIPAVYEPVTDRQRRQATRWDGTQATRWCMFLADHLSVRAERERQDSEGAPGDDDEDEARRDGILWYPVEARRLLASLPTQLRSLVRRDGPADAAPVQHGDAVQDLIGGGSMRASTLP